MVSGSLCHAQVPGCGRGYAVECLALSGRHTTGIEIASTAAHLARAHLASTGLLAHLWEIVVADVFAYEPAQPFDLIYDATFLCSLPPTKRREWAAAMRRLLKPGGEVRARRRHHLYLSHLFLLLECRHRHDLSLSRACHLHRVRSW